MDMDQIDIKVAIAKEAGRIEEDALHSMKGHFNAAAVWDRAHLWMGLPAAVLAALAGINAFSHSPELTSFLSISASGLVAALTFLNPESIADSHRGSGREYNTLKNGVRRFREIGLLTADEVFAVNEIEEFARKRDFLNSSSRDIPRWAYEKVKRDIDEGRAGYKVDIEK